MRAIRVILIVVEILLALNAIGGGIYGLRGAPEVPRALLQHTPFESYVIPGLFLLIVVGGAMVTAAATVLLRPRRGAWASLIAGAILILWIIVQVAMIGYLSWLQPICLVLGILICVLALLLAKRDA